MCLKWHRLIFLIYAKLIPTIDNKIQSNDHHQIVTIY